MKLVRSKKLIFAFAFAGIAGCSDSSGPGSVGADEALRSLSLGLGSGSAGGLPFALSPSSLGTASRGIDQINVSINGTTHGMFALGLRMTFPTGTCLENLFVLPPSFGFPSGECSAPPLGLVLVLWQTTSGSRPPKRMAFISADVGTSNFAIPDLGDYAFSPPFAIYINDQEEFWTSVSGTLTSGVTIGAETCNVPAPPFAASSTCNFATFEEDGNLNFELFDFSLFAPGTSPVRQTMDFVIPRQSLRGIVQTITEIKPITFDGGDWDY